jgi:non-ribosomal peptide synthetase-like protein
MLVIAAQLTWIPSGGSWLEGVLEHPWTMLPAALGFALASLVAYMAATLAAAAAAKWILIGRYRPGRVQAWSSLHLRHWIVTRLAALAPWDFLETTGFAPHALRLFGARIGRGVHIHRGVRLVDGGWDLLTLEDGATIGQDACIRAVELDRGTLLFGTVTVRRDATLETRAGMSPGAELGEGSILRPLSNLRGGPSPARTIFDGVPALAAGAAPDPPVVRTRPRPVLAFVAANAVTAAVVATLLVPWILAWSILESQSTGSLHGFLFHSDSWIPSLEGIVRLLATIASAGVATVLLKAMLVRMLGPAPRGAYALSGLDARRMALQSMLVEAAGKWLSGTLMWPIWLNLAGARIGRGCEISTVTDVVPSTVTIGRETFFADGIYLGGPTLHAGTARLDPVTLGESCFVGNHAVLPGGTTLAEGTLVGISTRGDGIPHEPGTSWFGHPAFRLPRREIVEMPRELTHDPTLIRRINRWCWEVARFGLPVVPVLAGLAWFRAMEDAERSLGMTSFRLIALPAALLAVFCSLALATLTLKWILIGRVRPGTHALWSCWCSRWDFLYVAWGLWASIPLGFLEGTRILVLYLRAMGCRIGRRALLGHGFAHVVDPDMLRFGDDVTVDALFQAHTFEDRVLKVDFVDLRDGSSVGPNTVLLYGADIGEGASVAPHSVVMKREVLPGGSRYEGVPTQPA